MFLAQIRTKDWKGTIKRLGQGMQKEYEIKCEKVYRCNFG